MNIKELFKKINNNEYVPEWIRINGTHPKYGRYSIDGKNFHYNKNNQIYFEVGVNCAFYTLDFYKSSYRKDVWEQFLVEESNLTEEEKQNRLDTDKQIKILEDIGIEINY